MFGTLGGPEIFLILAIALIVFGPRKLPEIGKSMGRMLAEFRKASTEFQRTVEMEVEAEKRPPKSAAAPLPPAAAAADPAPETPQPAPADGSVAQGSEARVAQGPAEPQPPSPEPAAHEGQPKP